MAKTTKKKPVGSLKTLTKSNVWDLQENDVIRMWQTGEKDPEYRENRQRYSDIIRTAFLIEELSDDAANVKKQYTKDGYKLGTMKIDDENSRVLAVKKRPISRITDLTYENIRHITASKLLEVIDRNFGGGWDSISQSIQDIIESGFDISTTTLPKDRLHKKGGMYDKKVGDGFDVLEIQKGGWVEAIFAKVKPETEKPKMTFETRDDDEIPEDNYNKPDEDDEPEPEFNDDDITEENYRTTFDISDEYDEEEAAENVSDDSVSDY